MQARQMLIDGEIHPTDWLQAARFIALMSQAEGVKHSADLLSESNQKYIHSLSRRVRQGIANDKRGKGGLKVDGDCDMENSHLEKYVMENYVEHLTTPEDVEDMPSDFFLMVAREHLRIHTMSQFSAKYWLLEEFSTLKRFGEETFVGTLISEANSSVKVAQHRSEAIQIGVSPQGLAVRRLERGDSFSIPFSAVESAKSLRRCFHLCYLDEDFAESSLVVKFTSHRIAGALYRSLTEKHAFYSCETVHKNVETQFIRDLKVKS